MTQTVRYVDLSHMVMTKADTRTRIMDAAEELVLRNGFAGTSLDGILDEVGLTKGAFFHHFRSKHDLALALVRRFAETDAALLETAIERAKRVTKDSVQRALLTVALLEEAARDLPDENPGCLFASFAYGAEIEEPEIHEVIHEAFLHWRVHLGALFQAALTQRPPEVPTDAEALADMAVVVAEGSFIMARATGDSDVVVNQYRQYRNYLHMLFGET